MQREDKKQKWDVIFGHHSHVPQPIKNFGSGILSNSGGNVTSSKRRKKHISGLIMKCEICKVNNSNQLKLGKVHWCSTLNERKRKKMKKNKNLQKDEQKKKIKEVTVIVRLSTHKEKIL